MPALKTYVGFISHAWNYHDEYLRLENMLKSAPQFKFRNASVPCTNCLPPPLNKSKIQEALDEQIRISNVVLILSGMHAAHSEWVDTEISIAAKYQKPIIGVIPRGQKKIPKIVQESAKELVHWNTDSIVEAIRKHAA
jgi:hypothetical protein